MPIYSITAGYISDETMKNTKIEKKLLTRAAAFALSVCFANQDKTYHNGSIYAPFRCDISVIHNYLI